MERMINQDGKQAVAFPTFMAAVQTMRGSMQSMETNDEAICHTRKYATLYAMLSPSAAVRLKNLVQADT